MTVAALEALALRESLRRGVTGLSRRYFHSAAKPIGVAWSLATGTDLAFPEVEGRRTRAISLTNRYIDWVLTACETDSVVGLQFLRVSFLVDPPARLFHPSFIYRVAAANQRRRQRDSQPHQASLAS
jgi:hypothetical protein